VNDHLIPHITRKKTVKDMYDSLGTLSQSVNILRKMLLKDKLNTTCMRKTYTLMSYLMKIEKLRDQIAVVGDIVENMS
jgi:hypothetical protein